MVTYTVSIPQFPNLTTKECLGRMYEGETLDTVISLLKQAVSNLDRDMQAHKTWKDVGLHKCRGMNARN